MGTYFTKIRALKIFILFLTLASVLVFAFKNDAALLREAYEFSRMGIITHAPGTFIANVLLVLIIPILYTLNLFILFYQAVCWLKSE